MEPPADKSARLSAVHAATEPSATDLLHHLTAIRTEAEFKAYLEAHTCSSPSFSAYYNNLLGRKNISLAAAVKRSALERHYACQIVNGTRTNAGRDKSSVSASAPWRI